MQRAVVAVHARRVEAELVRGAGLELVGRDAELARRSPASGRRARCRAGSRPSFSQRTVVPGIDANRGGHEVVVLHRDVDLGVLAGGLGAQVDDVPERGRSRAPCSLLPHAAASVAVTTTSARIRSRILPTLGLRLTRRAHGRRGYGRCDEPREERGVARRRRADQPRPAAVRRRRTRPSAISSTTSTRCSDRIIPVLEDRPLSVIRVHRGQEAFMQKNVPKYTPEWVRTVDVLGRDVEARRARTRSATTGARCSGSRTSARSSTTRRSCASTGPTA